LHPEYDAICVRATAVDPRERYATVRELHDAVARVLDGERDMRLRVELAAGHLAEAEKALSSEAIPGVSRADASRNAMHHAARSLALHPASKEAAALVSRLMLTPPDEIPAEVEVEMSQLAGEEGKRSGVNVALVGIPLLGLIVALLMWLGVRSWSAVALMLVPLGISACLGVWVGRAPTNSPWPSLASTACLSVALAGASRLAGPLWFPPLCGLMIVSMVSWNHGLGRWRIACVAMVLVGTLAPFVLEVFGVVASQYVFRDGGLMIMPDMIALPQGRIDIAMAVGSVFAIVMNVLASFRFSDADVETRRRLQLVAWHLRGLAPDGTDDAEDSASNASNPAFLSDPHADVKTSPLEDTQSTLVEPIH
jgi:serine/threonine-protein kinase